MGKQSDHPRAYTKKAVQKGWLMYDWANSAYFLVITTAIFPLFYTAITTTTIDGVISDAVSFMGKTFINTQLYSYIIAASFLIVIIASPLLSGMADYLGRKLLFLKCFCYVGAAGCIGLYWFDVEHLEWSMSALFMANIGAWGSLGFYNAFLPEIAEREEQDLLSAKGYSWGFAGAVILLVMCLALIMGIGDQFTRWAFVGVGLWWAGWAQITFRRLPVKVKERPEGNIMMKGFHELRGVARELKGKTRIVRYLLSFFVMSMAIQTIMLMASSFGIKEVKLASDELIIAILLIQLIAIPGAFLFSWLSKQWGNVTVLLMATAMWAGVCLFAYFLVDGSAMFFVAAGIVGFMMGGTQSLNRSTYTKMLPETEDTASYFSFYEVLEKLGVVIGMFSWGYIEGLTGSMRSSILALIGFFAVAMILLASIPRAENNISVA
jgi:UMF1 family MFS transporter